MAFPNDISSVAAGHTTVFPMERVEAPLVGRQPDAIPEVHSLFQQPWWLDATAPGCWAAATVIRGGSLVARLPYTWKKKYGLRVSTPPALTPFLGPWVRPSTAKYARRLGEEMELLEELLIQIPEFDYFALRFHPGMNNWLPFYWAGFQQTTQYTYRFDDLTDTGKIWAGFQPNLRNHIKQARNSVAVREDLDLQTFWDIHRKTFARQGIEVPYSYDFLSRLEEACAKRTARKILAAQDASGAWHAAIYVVWDQDSAYYLMGGGDPGLRSSGAHSLLLWEAIQMAASLKVKAFDFEGSMIRKVERFVRDFGARQVPIMHVWKMSPRLGVVSGIRASLQALRSLGRSTRRSGSSASAGTAQAKCASHLPARERAQ